MKGSDVWVGCDVRFIIPIGKVVIQGIKVNSGGDRDKKKRNGYKKNTIDICGARDKRSNAFKNIFHPNHLITNNMKVELFVIQERDYFGNVNQNRHFNLVKLLNNYAQFKDSIIYHEITRTTNNCNEFLTIEEINQAVVVLTDILNLSAGSSGHVNLYQLLQKYLGSVI